MPPLFKDVDAAGIAEYSGVGMARLEKLARTFGGYQRPAAIPGGAVTGYTNGVQATIAVMLLNVLMGNLNKDQSALWLTPPAPDPIFASTPVSKFSDVQTLIEAMKAGQVDVLFVHGNPLYELPVAAGFAEGLAKVPVRRVVQFHGR